jgi:hypothetical protein
MCPGLQKAEERYSDREKNAGEPWNTRHFPYLSRLIRRVYIRPVAVFKHAAAWRDDRKAMDNIKEVNEMCFEEERNPASFTGTGLRGPRSEIVR